MDNWIPATQFPDTEDWVQVMTQDGTIYPASFIRSKMIWSPMFRGGEVVQLYHGKVLYWQPHAEGYPMVNCESCGRKFLKTPSAQTCPVCAAFRGASAAEAPKEELVTEVTGEPIAEPIIREETKPAVRRGGRKKKEE